MWMPRATSGYPWDNLSLSWSNICIHRATSGHPGLHLNSLGLYPGAAVQDWGNSRNIWTAGATSGHALGCVGGGEGVQPSLNGGWDTEFSWGHGVFTGTAQGNAPSCLGGGFYHPKSCKNILNLFMQTVHCFAENPQGKQLQPPQKRARNPITGLSSTASSSHGNCIARNSATDATTR